MKGLIKKLGKLLKFNFNTVDVPPVCIGYLPHRIKIRQKLKEISGLAGLSDKDAEKILRQIRTYKNN